MAELKLGLARFKPWTIPIALLFLPLTPLGPAQASPADPCADYHFMEGVGNVCELANGLIDIYAPTGVYVGASHGPDPLPDDAGGSAVASSISPVPVGCVAGAPGEYYAQLIYARASDDTDNYAAKVGMIRQLANLANGYVHYGGEPKGRMVDLRVKCDGNRVPIVYDQVLPTALCCDTFATIKNDLRNQGFNDVRVHYWVFYDHGGFGASGQGNICWDDVASVNNCNNGNDATPAYAITYNQTGDWGALTMAHELSHNMGAVQDSAPSSTGAGHCWDGLDVMCYDDGGPNGHLYAETYCVFVVYDCGYDDYFRPNAPSGTYFDNHWNIGATYNRYLVFGKPFMEFVDCTDSVQTGFSMSCNFRATDVDSVAVNYAVDWGDGQTSTTGFTTPGYVVTLSHTYASGAAGLRIVSVTATDWEGAGSDTVTATVDVTANYAPVMDVLSCPSTIGSSYTFSCSFRASDATSSQVYYEFDWGDGTPLAYTGFLSPGVTIGFSHTYASPGTYVARVTATDDGNPRLTSSPLTASVTATFERPVMNSISCPTRVDFGASASCSFSASDVDSNWIIYRVDWGDGNALYTSWVPPGTPGSMAHTYAALGTYTVTVTATDDGNPQQTSGALAGAIEVIQNQAPTLNPVSCSPNPVASGAPVSCTLRADDPSDDRGVYYLINWKDGNTDRYPATGSVPAGEDAVVTHTYVFNGCNCLLSPTFQAFDMSGAASGVRSLQIGVDGSPPQLTLFEPERGRIYRGCTKVPGPAVQPDTVLPTYLDRGCVEVSASDWNGVTDISVFLDGERKAQRTTGPSVSFLKIEFDVDGLAAGKGLPRVVSVVATDTFGWQTTVSRTVWIPV